MSTWQVLLRSWFSATTQKTEQQYNTFVADVRSVSDAVRHSDCVVVCTDWDEFKTIDWASMASEMQVSPLPPPPRQYPLIFAARL